MAYQGATAAILSNYDEVLKTFYLPAIQEQLNHDTILADKIDVNEEDVSGKNATIECHYGRTKGTGARADGGSLPEADFQRFKKCTVPMRYMYGRVTFSGPTIAATRDEKGSYARVVDTEITGVVQDLKMEVNRMLWGCGYGIVSRWRTTVGATSYTVQKRYRSNSVGGDGFGSTFGGKYFEENGGGTPVVVASTGSSKITTTTVDTSEMAVSAVTTTVANYDTITCTNPTVTEAAGTYYVRLGSARSIAASSAAGYTRLEMMGLRGMVTNTDLDEIGLFDNASGSGNRGCTVNDPLQTLDVSGYPWFKANVDSHTSGRYLGQRALTLNLMQKMFDKVEQKAGKDYGPDMILTTRAIRREYLQLCLADRRAVNTMELDGGWTGLDYNGVPLVVDNDAIDGEMYFVTLKDLQIYRMSDYDWMTKDGSVLHLITGYDAYEAVLYRYAEAGIKRRNSQGVITDIAYEL